MKNDAKTSGHHIIQPTWALLYESACIMNELLRRKGVTDRVHVNADRTGLEWVVPSEPLSKNTREVE